MYCHRAASTVALKSSQLFCPGLMVLVAFRAFTRLVCWVGERLPQSCLGARSRACARKAASTRGWPPCVKFMQSADFGSTLLAID